MTNVNLIDFIDFPAGTETVDERILTVTGLGGGGGDVTGPAGATANNIAVFNGATGKIIKDGGYTIAALLALIPYTFTVTVAFGSSFTDKAQAVVTGLTWLTANTRIIPQVKTPSGSDPDELYLLDFKPQVSDLVAGTGFTLTVYSEAEAKGNYDVMCIAL